MGTGTYERWPVEKIIVKENVRKQFNNESLRRLAESLKRDGQLRPLLVLRDCTLVAGERGLRASILAGLPHVDVKVLEGDVGPREVRKLQVIENVMREELKDAELYLACKDLMALNPELLKKDLMAELHFDPSMAARIFAVDELIPEAKEAFLNGAFGFSKAYAIVKGSPQDQRQKLAEILAGSTRDEVERQGRTTRTKSPAVRANKITIHLGSGRKVTINGTDLTLDDGIEAAVDARKLMEAGRKQGLTAKTIQRVSAEKAKTRPE